MENWNRLFAELDQVDWAEAWCCSDHPEKEMKLHLRRTLSDDPQVVDTALYELFEMTWHQSTRYPGTLVALPLLMELLDLPDFSGKVRLLKMLSPYATGFDDYFLPYGVDSYEEDGYPWNHQTYLLLGEHIHRVLPHLHDQDPEVRTLALYTLGWYGHQAVDLVGPVLQHAMQKVQPVVEVTSVSVLTPPDLEPVQCDTPKGDPVEQVTCLITLGMLARHHQREQVESYLQYCLASTHAPVRLGAALGLISLESRNPRVLESLFEVLSGVHTLFPQFRKLPYEGLSHC